jgi:ferrochelatase
MSAAGVKHALAVVLAAYSSYSSCRQYREDLEQAREKAGPGAPVVDKLRVFFNHPDFIAANAERVGDALERIPADLRGAVHIAFTAHSIPSAIAAGCDYEKQLAETCRLVAEALGIGPDRWKLLYQSRSGRPTDPWLEPEILDHLSALHDRDIRAVVVHPIGFLSDHIEVLFDLDLEAKPRCDQLGLTMARSATVGTHPKFVAMLCELIDERITGAAERRAVGRYPASHDVCPVDCCLPPSRPQMTGPAAARG